MSTVLGKSTTLKSFQEPKPHSPYQHGFRKSTVASLGVSALRQDGYHPPAPISLMHLATLADSKRVYRNHLVRKEDDVAYQDFSPPSVWEPTYAILRARFGGAGPRDAYMSHPGEAFVIPIDGRVICGFALPKHVDPIALRRSDEEPMRSGTIARIRPTIPHHIYGDGPAEAFLVLRDLGETIAATRQPTNDVSSSPEWSFSFDSLTSNPLRYALLVSGVPQRLRAMRQRAGLQISELARYADIDRSYLSKIEDALANLSLECALCLGDILGCNLLADLPCSSDIQDYYQEISLKTVDTKSASPISFKSPISSALAMEKTYISCGESIECQIKQDVQSWLLISGEALIIPKGDAPLARSFVVQAGEVVHFKKGATFGIRSLASSQFVSVRHA